MEIESNHVNSVGPVEARDPDVVPSSNVKTVIPSYAIKSITKPAKKRHIEVEVRDDDLLEARQPANKSSNDGVAATVTSVTAEQKREDA